MSGKIFEGILVKSTSGKHAQHGLLYLFQPYQRLGLIHKGFCFLWQVMEHGEKDIRMGEGVITKMMTDHQFGKGAFVAVYVPCRLLYFVRMSSKRTLYSSGASVVTKVSISSA